MIEREREVVGGVQDLAKERVKKYCEESERDFVWRWDVED